MEELGLMFLPVSGVPDLGGNGVFMSGGNDEPGGGPRGKLSGP